MRTSDRAMGGVVLACAVVACAIGCSNKITRQPLPDWSGGYDTGGTSDGGGVPEHTFGIAVPASVEYPTRLRVLGTKDTPCALPVAPYSGQGGLANDIHCVLDMDELDVFVEGVTFDIVVPQGGCDYVLYSPYLYESWQTGTGPTTVSYTVQPDGTFSDEVNSQNGVPACAFDYSHTNVGGPNCCGGTYTLTVTSAQTGKKTTSVADWGGISAKCFDGAAFLRDGVVVDPSGYPEDPIYAVKRAAQTIPIHHKGLSDTYPPINVPLANYWNEGASSGSTPPAALTGPGARQNYQLLCLDNADEILGRITFDVREWNEKAQLEQDGDPDTSGTEPYYAAPINDFLDWADLAAQGKKFTQVVRR